MSADLLAALCLVAVLEGLFLLAAPGAWKRFVVQMLELDERTMRIWGAVMVGIGLVALKLVR